MLVVESASSFPVASSLFLSLRQRRLEQQTTVSVYAGAVVDGADGNSPTRRAVPPSPCIASPACKCDASVACIRRNLGTCTTLFWPVISRRA